MEQGHGKMFAITDYEGTLITKFFDTVDEAWNRAKDFMKVDHSGLCFHYDICQNCQEGNVPKTFDKKNWSKQHNSSDGREYPHDCMNALLDETPEETLLNYFDCRLLEETDKEEIKEMEKYIEN
jgi:hypothetical protein